MEVSSLTLATTDLVPLWSGLLGAVVAGLIALGLERLRQSEQHGVRWHEAKRTAYGEALAVRRRALTKAREIRRAIASGSDRARIEPLEQELDGIIVAAGEVRAQIDLLGPKGVTDALRELYTAAGEETRLVRIGTADGDSDLERHHRARHRCEDAFIHAARRDIGVHS